MWTEYKWLAFFLFARVQEASLQTAIRVRHYYSTI